MHACHPDFHLLRTAKLAGLSIELQHYEHRMTGAQHYHLSSDHSEQVFMVAFRTMPQDSTGVAHILEHTSLCGSQAYPVRDPFFMMTRRSLNTFMNAFTASDWTAYPFASENSVDFNNLLAVYLDAVFFPNLDVLDFKQEGHRLELKDPQDPASGLSRQGVVYNEMKGAMSSPLARIWQRLSSELFSHNTYHYNSGGEPTAIGQLTHAELLAFHGQHYHPSNAIFMTFGPQPAAELQHKMVDLALNRFSDRLPPLAVEPEQVSAPRLATGEFPASAEQVQEGGHWLMAWVWPASTDIVDLLTARLLADLLLDHSASPLRQWLETHASAQAPSGLCGLDDSGLQMIFVAGLEGVQPEDMPGLAEQMMAQLTLIAEQGFAEDELAAALHQLELMQREIAGDSFPYGLKLMMQALPAATHRADVAAALDLNPHLQQLAERVAQPGWLSQRLREWLLDNPHRVELHYRPSAQLAQEEQQAEEQELADIFGQMKDDDIAQLQRESAALLARQQQTDDDSLLPKVSLADVRQELRHTPAKVQTPAYSFYQQGTNGLCYQSWIHALTDLPSSAALLPLYSAVLTELGAGDQDYLAMQRRQNASLGSLGVQLNYRACEQSADRMNLYVAMTGKALTSKQRALSELQQLFVREARFDESQRLQELISQIKSRREQGITGNGHGLMMLAASQGLSPMADFANAWSGVPAIVAARRWLGDLAPVREGLQALHQHLWAGPGHLLQITDQAQVDLSAWSADDLGAISNQALVLPEATTGLARRLWLTNTGVNFCARAYKAAPLGSVDAPALMVLAHYLRNGHLHAAIRERGGAYGGGASFDAGSATFRFYSYRDVRSLATFDDFSASLTWLFSAPHSAQALEEAILSVVANMDKPLSPAGSAKSAFWQQQFGRTLAKRQQLLADLLAVSVTDLQRVAAKYLQGQDYQDAILSSEQQASSLQQAGFVFQATI